MNWNKLLSMVGLASLLSFLSGCITNQNETSVSQHDRAFIREAAAEGLKGMELGRIGVEKAQSPEIRQLAQRILDDHAQANAELIALATQNGIEATTATNAPTAVSSLQTLSGRGFEEMYITHIIQDHERDIREYRASASHLENYDLKKFVISTLPALQKDLYMAQRIATNRGFTGSTVIEPSGAMLPTTKNGPEPLGGNRFYGGERARPRDSVKRLAP